VVRPFKVDLSNDITPTAVEVRWGWEIRNLSKPAKYVNEGDTTISIFSWGIK